MAVKHLLFILILIGLLTGTASAATSIYIVSPMNDSKILPNSTISPAFISNNIFIRSPPGEFTPASFVINSSQPISNLQVTCSALTGTNGFIPSSAVDIRTVKCWYQSGHNLVYNPTGQYLTPELLLHDDSLINVTGDTWPSAESNPIGANSLKVNGFYINISNHTRVETVNIPITSRPIVDHTSLQALNLPANYNKQFWITLYPANNIQAGNYTGTISITNGTQTISTIRLNVEILPFTLPDTGMEYSVYYRGYLSSSGSITSDRKTEEQYRAEMINLKNHGVTSPAGGYNINATALIAQNLKIRQELGMNNTNYYKWMTRNEIVNETAVQQLKAACAPYGVKNVYYYGPDERNMNTTDWRTRLANEHAWGAKHYTAQSWGDAIQVADILDTCVAGFVDKETAALYHSYGHKILSYGNPQAVPELPRTFRMNYGLYLWQNDYDGAMDFIYCMSQGDIWNDWDSNEREYGFVYPTSNGVIDTIQWEGFREGVNDVRYVKALESVIETANANGKAAIAAEAQAYLNTLKSSDLNTQDLDVIRENLINYTIACNKNSHYLLIDQGKGSGFYSPNTQVTIKANPPQKGMVFDKWTGDTQYVSNINATSTKVTATDHAISLTATYMLSDLIGSWYDTDYKNRKLISINHSQVSNTDQKDFPVLINLKNNELKTFANGGKVQSGYDIIFALPDKTLLTYELINYNGTTGNLKAWVKIPALYSNINTTVCLYFNNGNVATSQENKTGVWTNHYAGVWHLEETGTGKLGDFKDSSPYSSNSVNRDSQPIKSSVIPGGSQHFVSGNYINVNGANLNLSNEMTISCFVNKTGSGSPDIICKNLAGFGDMVYVVNWHNSSGRFIFWSVDNGKTVLTATSQGGYAKINRPLCIYCTFDGKDILWYVNGSYNRIYSADLRLPINFGDFIIGGRADSKIFNGEIGEVRLSNVVRSADWVKTEYNTLNFPDTFITIGSTETRSVIKP